MAQVETGVKAEAEQKAEQAAVQARKRILTAGAQETTQPQAAPSASAEPPKRALTVPADRVKDAEFQQHRWVANAEMGTTIEDVLKPDYFAHVAEMMKPYDHVEVRMDDGSWVAEVIVTACDRNWARVHLLWHHQLVLDTEIPVASVKYVVDWKGPQHQWCVLRKSDGAKMKTAYGSKEAALGWLREHERTLS